MAAGRGGVLVAVAVASAVASAVDSAVGCEPETVVGEAVATAEALHGRIETDFHSLRAAEIAARSGQSFEQMRHEAGAHSDPRESIEVPDAETAIDTVGDLRAYRKAMDAAVNDCSRLPPFR